MSFSQKIARFFTSIGVGIKDFFVSLPIDIAKGFLKCIKAFLFPPLTLLYHIITFVSILIDISFNLQLLMTKPHKDCTVFP